MKGICDRKQVHCAASGKIGDDRAGKQFDVGSSGPPGVSFVPGQPAIVMMEKAEGQLFSFCNDQQDASTSLTMTRVPSRQFSTEPK
jgi:hypothetical protein